MHPYKYFTASFGLSALAEGWSDTGRCATATCGNVPSLAYSIVMPIFFNLFKTNSGTVLFCHKIKLCLVFLSCTSKSGFGLFEESTRITVFRSIFTAFQNNLAKFRDIMTVFRIKVLLMNHKFKETAPICILRRFFKLRYIGLRLRRQIHYTVDFRIRDIEIAVVPKVTCADMRNKFRRVTIRYVRPSFPVDIETPRKIPIADLSERGNCLRCHFAKMNCSFVRQRLFSRKTHDLSMDGQAVGDNGLRVCIPIRKTWILFSGMERQIQPICIFFPFFTECIRHHRQVKIRRIRRESLEILCFVK